MKALKINIILLSLFLSGIVCAQISGDTNIADSRLDSAAVSIPDSAKSVSAKPVSTPVKKDTLVLSVISPAVEDTVFVEIDSAKNTNSVVKDTSSNGGIEKIIPGDTLDLINRINVNILIEVLLLLAAAYLLSKLIDKLFILKKHDSYFTKPKAAAGLIKTIVWLSVLYFILSMFIKISYEVLPFLLAAVILFSMTAMLPFAFNIVGGLFISFAMPFVENDYIEIKDYKGTVKKITLKATSLFNDEMGLIHVPNSYFLKYPVANASKSKDEHTLVIDFEFPADMDSKLILDAVKTAALSNPYTSTDSSIKVYIKQIDLIKKLQNIELYVNICDSKFENEMKNLLNINILQVIKKEKRL